VDRVGHKREGGGRASPNGGRPAARVPLPLSTARRLPAAHREREGELGREPSFRLRSTRLSPTRLPLYFSPVTPAHDALRTRLRRMAAEDVGGWNASGLASHFASASPEGEAGGGEDEDAH